ncbi:hypothetical protein cyc_03606 [Cyclospora cayetanensis]|uniref:Uncharacterized protein n=1 Tax=Cyclospora cayetanensis TaxID=88456 RepID=A0A1D3CSY2_9EIME|nr:hypothetical protein cyc_03606 [Cyclospora cayetanensis]
MNRPTNARNSDDAVAVRELPHVRNGGAGTAAAAPPAAGIPQAVSAPFFRLVAEAQRRVDAAAAVAARDALRCLSSGVQQQQQQQPLQVQQVPQSRLEATAHEDVERILQWHRAVAAASPLQGKQHVIVQQEQQPVAIGVQLLPQLQQLVPLEDLTVSLPPDIRSLLKEQQQRREEQQQKLYGRPWHIVPRLFARLQQQHQSCCIAYACIGGQILHFCLDPQGSCSTVRRLPLRLSSRCRFTCSCTSRISDSKFTSGWEQSVACSACTAAGAASVQRQQRLTTATDAGAGFRMVEAVIERLLVAADSQGNIYLLQLNGNTEGGLFRMVSKGVAALFRRSAPNVARGAKDLTRDAAGPVEAARSSPDAAGAAVGTAALEDTGCCAGGVDGFCPVCFEQLDDTAAAAVALPPLTEDDERRSSRPPAAVETVAYMSGKCWKQRLLPPNQEVQLREDSLQLEELMCSFTPEMQPLLTLITSRGDRVVLLVGTEQQAAAFDSASSSKILNGSPDIGAQFSLRILSVLHSPDALQYHQELQLLSACSSNCTNTMPAEHSFRKEQVLQEPAVTQPQHDSSRTNSNLRLLLEGHIEGFPECAMLPTAASAACSKEPGGVGAAAETATCSSRRLWLFTSTEFLLVEAGVSPGSSRSPSNLLGLLAGVAAAAAM